VNFVELRQFISEDMQIQHVYQPVMLITLLKKGGQASEAQIARAILDLDPVQQKYYEDKVRTMVGKVLANRRVTRRVKTEHQLLDFDELTPAQIDELTAILEERLAGEIVTRGDGFWKHRATDREPIPGSVRHSVLERAMGRCESCGISKEERNLDVDHVVPRSKGGKNEISNYQALCWLCNTSKGNRSNTDFRGLEQLYKTRQKDCLFCDLRKNEPDRIVGENHLVYAAKDGRAVTEGHTLFMPKRHVEDYFGLTQAEVISINSLMEKRKAELEKSDPTIEGFNIGMNCGEVAGQTKFHCHVHLIPRRRGDVENPRGGIRHVIPGRGDYKD
jgi:ATP adenylyltransferase